MARVILLSNPRSGSNYLQDLLTCHPEVDLEGEILNDEFGLLNNPLETIQNTLSSLHKNYIGFKLFPEQLYVHKLHFGELAQSIGVTHVIILWREGLLEGFTSRQIAFSHDDWYSTKKSNETRKIEVDPQEFQEYINQLTTEWQKIGTQWPLDIRPIFVKFEDLIRQPIKEVERVLAELSCTSDHVVFVTPSERQNPAPIHQKVTNYNDLTPSLRNQILDVESILQEKINLSLQIPKDLLQFAPDREPCMPAGGWKYRVAEPYLPAIAKQNAFDTIHSGIISSAGHWPKELAKKLRTIFKYPVAQPCSNGFTALLLALQCADIQEGDEVIVPTMTMVAVPNAVYYLRATPVFADNAPTGSYNPGWKEYEAKASAQTKAIIVTHTYGVPCTDIELIAEQCRSRGWVLIEDISECVGVSCSISSTNGPPKLLGTFGDYSIASLYANKIIHGGDGGFVLAKQASVGKRLASIVNHGFTPSFHFVHFEPAPNAKIHGIGAAIAAGCFDELKYIMEHRSRLAKWYRTNLKDVPVIQMPQCGPEDTPWVFGIQCRSKQERTQLRAFMAKYGIETRDFFFNLHLQPAYIPKDEKKPSLPNAEILGSTGFYLPTHTNLTEQDVEYICNILKLYFCSEDITLPESPSLPEMKQAVQIQPDSFSVQVRKYRGSGEALGTCTRGHIYLEAVKLGMDCEEALFHEQYDKTHLLLDSIQNLLERAQESKDPLASNMKLYFKSFITYFESQSLLEQPDKPWLASVNLNDKLFKISSKLPTTTDPETLQILAWLIKELKPSSIWEIGCWMGSATALMAEVSKEAGTKSMIFACDAFKWQAWMQPYLQDKNGITYRQEGKTFLPIFEENLKPFQDQVTPVEWPYDISTLPEILKNQRPQLVFLDITQEDEDLEEIWTLIKENLIPNETIILFNGLAHTSIPFFTRHVSELKAFAKPRTMAKAFLFVDPNATPKKPETYEEIQDMMRSVLPLKRSLKFHTNPEWNHHNDNVFCKAVNLLRKEYHSDRATILFIPAVEETMCDDLEILLENPWIGIIHSAKSHPELFYTPDLERLCTRPRYLAALKNCLGLFTLTQFQAEYLKSHLPSEILSKLPIQFIYYPIPAKQGEGIASIVPKLMKINTKPIELIHIGSFARDFEFFFRTPVPKIFVKVLVVGDESVQEAATQAPKDIILQPRLSEEEYEIKLRTSVVFLTLKHEGVANTLILECISQNVPILSPNISSCVEYLGENYPLFYDPQNPEQVEELLSQENIEKAISYLKEMDKSKFGYERFVEDVKNGVVMLSLPPGENIEDLQLNQIPNYSSKIPSKFDVTLCICSYKRTHHLSKILDSLWNHQDFDGTFQIVIWNNNDCRSDLVHSFARKYLETSSSDKKSLEIISSTDNHYCSVRFAMATLMKSECLLICDDDVIPGPNFISFFYSAHQKHPKDVLCVRGHSFLEHELPTRDPMKIWMDYDALRFQDDAQPEQLIHFVHADACLIPKQALHEVASVSMPDSSFKLVDDYWMSFVLSHKFNRKLRKLCTGGLNSNPIVRTEDSDTVGLALHTRPEVQDSRLRLYVHHMLQGWPSWNTETSVSTTLSEEEGNNIKKEKARFWKGTPQFTGFNISSLIDDDGIQKLSQMGSKCVRIGAVGIGERKLYEFSEFLTEPEKQLEKLKELVGKLGKVGICVVLTLDRRLASPETWKVIAGVFGQVGNLVGYDLINEPFTEFEVKQDWTDMEADTNLDIGMKSMLGKYKEMIHSIRQVDKLTPIILEPTFWSHIGALEKFPIEELMQMEDNLLISVHFYEPMRLTSRVQNKGRYSFPGSVPLYDGVQFSEEIYWDGKTILEKLTKAKLWADGKKLQIFLGEFGICRDIKGAPDYLQAVITACKEVGMMGFLFSFRDPDWEAMDYEFGPHVGNCLRKLKDCENPFLSVIQL